MKIVLLPSSEKGFNMFSAIVAVVLIMTVSVLVGTLVMSEEKTSTQIYGMLNNYQLADAANIARADALQSFNYSFREKMEDYLTYTDTEMRDEPGMGLFEIRTDSDTITFDQLQKKFEENILLNTNSSGQNFSSVLDYVSENTVTNFAEWTYGKYRVELTDKSPQAKKALYTALATVLNAQGSGFLEVVDCTESSCPKGSFYFNIPLNKLTDEQYELIPRIIVKDTFTQEQIKMAILPKTNLKVYIPLRFFKVLKESMDAAKGLKDSHQQNSEYRLGFCDNMSCVPRTDATTPTSGAWDKDCPTSEEAKWVVNLTSSHAGITNYFSGGDSVGVKGLWGYGAEQVCQNSINDGAFETGDPTFFVLNTFLDPSRKGAQIKEAISGCGYYLVTIGAAPEVYSEIKGGAGEKLFCGRIINTSADIAFVDTNPNFLVKGTSVTAGQKSNVYKIRISDISFPSVIMAEYGTVNHYCYTGLGKCTPSIS